MKSRIICILLFNLIFLFVSAGTRKLNFQVYDELTQLGIRPFVEVYNATDTSKIINSFSSLKIGEFSLNIDENLQKIIIKIYGTREEVKNNKIWHFKSDYYTPKCIELELNSDLPNPYNHPAVYLERYRQKDLKEVTVTASKVMFYHKGDTLIYNADAFVTPQGSTLDALIRQLPGVEIDNSGTITCDGRRIDMLMLNGRDFFDGNSKILLNNLDAFTVKDIAVYEKLGHTSELMQRKTGDEKRVMDVRLKRQYHIGMMTNNDIGYGTHDRYLANIFGVGFSDYLSVSAFANLNNLSDKADINGQESSWSRERMGSGVSTNQSGGITYKLQGRHNKWDLKGDAKISNAKTTDITNCDIINFLPTGDIYNYRWSNNIAKDMEISTSHELFAKTGDRVQWNITPSFSHGNVKNNSDLTEASFNNKIEQLSKDEVQSLYDNNEKIPNSIINRNIRTQESKSKFTDSKLQISSSIRLRSSKNPNMINASTTVAYKSLKEDDMTRYLINTGTIASPTVNQSKLNKRHPSDNMTVNPRLSFTQFIDFHNIRMPIDYDFKYERKKSTSLQYVLNSAGNSITTDDFTPESFAPDESYWFTNRSYSHKVGISAANIGSFMLHGDESHGLSVNLAATITSTRQNLTLHTPEKTGIYSHTDILPMLMADFGILHYLPGKWNCFLTERLSSAPVNMLDLADLPQSDPLLLFLGNPKLKQSKTNNLSFKAWRSGKNQHKHNISINYVTRFDDFAKAYLYNLSTGESIFRTYNVSGNRSASASYQYFFPFGKNKRFNLTTTTAGTYVRSKDLVGTFDSPDVVFNDALRLNTVKTMSANENIKIQYKWGKNSITTFADINYRHYTGNDPGFNDFSSWTNQYGAATTIQLPADWSITSDLTMTTRRGFCDARLNTSEWVWNARLSKSIMNGSMTFAVDAYDLLHQLSNITYTVNAQARTEVRSNVVPAYVLFHMQFRFNHNPKQQ